MILQKHNQEGKTFCNCCKSNQLEDVVYKIRLFQNGSIYICEKCIEKIMMELKNGLESEDNIT